MTATSLDEVGDKLDIAVIGRGRLGRMLATALAQSGHPVVTDCTDVLGSDATAADRLRPVASVAEAAHLLLPPRRLLIAAPAGSPVDTLIDEVMPELTPGDVMIDAGNSHHADTARRVQLLAARGILFLGVGVSAGDEAGRRPAFMVGGNPQGWPLVAEMFRSIAGRSSIGGYYCLWVGSDGAGHFVKTVHNAIEYADMQCLAEAYQLMRVVLGLGVREQHDVFLHWGTTELESYLVAITADILGAEHEDGTPVLDHIVDVADQHGTGAWAVSDALELGVPATVVAAAVHARSLSAMKQDRLAGAEVLLGPTAAFGGSGSQFLDDLARAILATRVVALAQAFLQLRRGSDAHRWDLDLNAIARLWEGSIIQSALLDEVGGAVVKDPALHSVLLDDRIRACLDRSQASWRRIAVIAAEHGVPTPVISAALTFYDGYRTARLPADLIQAQRDYFAAHGYERTDGEDGVRYHTDWARTVRNI